MHETDLTAISGWLTTRGLAGAEETELLDGFCLRCRDAGVPVGRALVLIDTLHPVYEGRAFPWRSDGQVERAVVEYGSTAQGERADEWRRTAFFHLLDTGASELRRRFFAGDPADFALIGRLRDEGQTDCLVMAHRFTKRGTIGEMDCFLSQWTTEDPEGFKEAGIEALRRLVPALGLAIKCASLARITTTLAEVYLGRDAGTRVLGGRIARGVADRIEAVLWFSDLRGYTQISDSSAPEEILPLLNDYADAVISSIHQAGGNVLKLVGDGVLAIFESERAEDASAAALDAEALLRERLAQVNSRRSDEGRPLTEVYLGLHIGDVFYGNIGSEDRLDFTVVGPAVNEVSRIASMCRSVDRVVVMSSEFAAALPEVRRADLVSVGRYALRGVRRAQELFTLDPALRPPVP